MASCLMILRSTASHRWLSTATAVAQHRKKTPLFYKLSQLKITADSDNTKVTEILNEWVNKGKFINKFDITEKINLFRSRKNYHIALQLSEWMESSKVKVNDADRAIHIDLLAKTKGITSAEKYFNSLQEYEKTKKTYGALLNCYCKEKNSDKALYIFSKIKELDVVSTLNYNNVLSLFLSTNQPEKATLLVQEMEEKNIKADMYTYNLLMNCYASQKDLNKVEEVFQKIKMENIDYDWFTYGNLATIYVNAGLPDEAKAFLEKIEKFEDLHDREAFHTLITLYRRMSNMTGVNRAWASLKTIFPTPSNTSYLMMLLAISELGDPESLEKCFREWESGCSLYDVRLFNVLLESYLNRSMIEEANVLYESMLQRGSEPNLRTLDLFINYHIKKSQIDLALKYLEMGTCKVIREKHQWFPGDETIKMFLKYFEEKNDFARVDKFCNSMKKINRLDSAVYDSLLCTKVATHEVKA